MVITIHDIISLLFPENIPFASRMFYSKWMPFSYRKATQIITISDSTKADIQSILKIPEEKITVIPLAVDERFKSPVLKDDVARVKEKLHLPDRYILHVGTLEPRKNLEFLIEAFAKTLEDDKNRDLNLVITGKKGWYFEGLFSKVKKLKLGRKVIFTGYIDEEDKPALCKGARLFAFPSLYEGFGLPPLEAMASGVPVISSNTSSMPEVVGEAGILISPKNKDAWVEAITRVNSDSKLREQMIDKNKIQVARFSWANTAKKTIEVYQKAYDQYHKERKR